MFQPFDRGAYDKRYDDIIAPAVKAAGLEPYRVDRDDGAVIPVETLHDEIRSATLCLADIGTRNPNVMYELGFAVASGKDVIIICSNQLSGQFPFDIQHRGIILYASDSASDFDKLKADITNRVKALLRKQVTTESIAAASPMRTTEGLQPHEISTLAFVMVNSAAGGSFGAAAHEIKQAMNRAGYTDAAAQLGLIRLSRRGLVETRDDTDNFGNSYTTYCLTNAGQDWLLDNQDKLQIHLTSQPARQRNMGFQKEPSLEASTEDDDVPF